MSDHGKPDRLTMLTASQNRQLGLCAELEDLADSMPHRLERARCLELGQAILRIVLEAQDVEERLLFPRVNGVVNWQADLGASIERLRAEHLSDICFGEEIGEALVTFGRDGGPVDAEVLGYMLRGFFEGLRRHLAFEREILLPLLNSPGPR